MNLLFYATKRDRAAERLQRVIQEVASQDKLEIYRTFGSLSQRLHQPGNGLNIAVLAPTGRGELGEILSLREPFSDIRIILILPDRERETISNAHKLLPRFLSYADRDFEQVKAVLNKMLESMRSREIQGKGLR